MPLETGTRLGPYQIVAPLGKGGMGEVYRASDDRLGRSVAIKVLPGEVSADPDRRRLFEREARAIAALNHPHICAVHDVGHQDGVDYLVMELLDGESLADRLVRGPLPFDEASPIALTVVETLDIDSPKTSGMVAKLKSLEMGRRPLLVTEEASENLYLSARNLPYVEVRDVQGLDPVALVGADSIVFTTDAVKKIEEWLA